MIWADLPTPDRTAAEAQDAAQEVLSRPEFHRPGPSIIERIEGWISDGLNRVLEVFSGVAGGGVIATVILVAAAALVGRDAACGSDAGVQTRPRRARGTRPDRSRSHRRRVAHRSSRPRSAGALASRVALPISRARRGARRPRASSTTSPARRRARSASKWRRRCHRPGSSSARPPPSSTTPGTAMPRPGPPRRHDLKDLSAAVLEQAQRHDHCNGNEHEGPRIAAVLGGAGRRAARASRSRPARLPTTARPSTRAPPARSARRARAHARGARRRRRPSRRGWRRLRHRARPPRRPHRRRSATRSPDWIDGGGTLARRRPGLVAASGHDRRRHADGVRRCHAPAGRLHDPAARGARPHRPERAASSTTVMTARSRASREATARS